MIQSIIRLKNGVFFKKCTKCKVLLPFNEFKVKRDMSLTNTCLLCLDRQAKYYRKRYKPKEM